LTAGSGNGSGGGLRAAARAHRLAARLAALMNYAAGWMFLVCAAFITFDVLARRYLGFSSRATTEVTGYMLAFGIAWGLAHTLTTRSHIRIDVLVNRLPLRPRMLLHAFALAMLAIMAVVIAWFAWLLVYESWEFSATDTSALRVPLIVPQGLWALGVTIFAIIAWLILIETIALVLANDPEGVDRLLGPRTYQDETAEALEAVGLQRKDKRA
jgi:TRAP-type C4-dicarboxylate transport system permease small subunit